MKFLCFSPNDAVWLWAKPQALVLKALRERGDTISYIYCDRTITGFCMAMASSSVPFDATDTAKDEVCQVCARNSRLLREFIGIEGHPMHRFVSADDRAAAARLSEMPISELRALEFRAVPVGRFALYEAMIQTKTIGRNLGASAEWVYRTLVRNACIVVCATEKMAEQFDATAGLTYHSAYTYNRSFRYVLEAKGIPVWSMNASLNVSEMDTHLLLARSEMIYKRAVSMWPSYREVPARTEDVAAVGDHIIALMRGGGFGYSNAIRVNPKSVDERLGILPGRKVVSAILSSYDELWASELAGFELRAESAVFPTQVDLVRWLFRFASARDDVHVVVRVHPREFKAGAGGDVSAHAGLLQQVFNERPANASVNLPSDGVSNYELLLRSDVVTVAWSSAGQEAALFGIPVVTYFDEVLAFPADLGELAGSPAAYAECIDRALGEEWSFHRAQKAFRWASMLLCRTRVDLTGGARRRVRDLPIEAFVRRALRKLRRSALPGSDPWWSLRTSPKKFPDAQRVFDLIDSGSDMFLDLEVPGSSGETPATEAESIIGQLRRVALVVRRATGRSATRLDRIIDEAEKSAVVGWRH